MVRRLLVLAVVSSLTLSVMGAGADAPVYDPSVVSPDVGRVIPGGECAAENAFDIAYPADFDGGEREARLDPRQKQYLAHVGPAYEQCQRLKIVFGPIWAKPGQNDVLIQPVTFEKPLYDGYFVRFKPDLVTADGAAPRVKDLHLHHGTWLNAGRSYGWGPFFASGEEKTVASWPKGFGVKVQRSDAWLFLHMIHNATPSTFPVWVTYDLDYIPAAVAETDSDNDGVNDIANTKQIWLDAGACAWDDRWSSQARPDQRCATDTLNPVFNVHRGFNASGKPGSHALPDACVFPRENCAMFNVRTNKSGQQGVDISNEFGGIKYEFTVPEDGTLVSSGGHVHNGGLRDDVYLVRDEKDAQGNVVETKVRQIFRSDAYYFDHDIDWKSEWTPGVSEWEPAASKIGAPPVSWDFVMTENSADLGWKVNVKAGDRIRLEGVYDSTIASWYEQMSIVMAWLAPTANTGGKHVGIDVFDPSTELHFGVNARGVQPGTIDGFSLPGSEHGACVPGATTLCMRGKPTHGRIPTSGDHWSCVGECQRIAETAPDGPMVGRLEMGGFGYGLADFGVIGVAGVPRVKLGSPVTFTNVDTADYMWHTVTRCALPCSGTTSASYPLADGSWDDVRDPETGIYTDPVSGRTAPHPAALGPDVMDFDSGQIGVGTGANQKLSWNWTPTRTGVFSFWCRIHPSMRGAVKVVA